MLVWCFEVKIGVAEREGSACEVSAVGSVVEAVTPVAAVPLAVAVADSSEHMAALP